MEAEDGEEERARSPQLRAKDEDAALQRLGHAVAQPSALRAQHCGHEILHTSSRNLEATRPPLQQRLADLKRQRLESSATDSSYIPLLCGKARAPNPEAKEETIVQEVQKRLRAQVKSNQACLIWILGPSGSGKSITMRQLERLLWGSFDAADVGRTPQVIPILLELRTVALTKERDARLRRVALEKLQGLLTERDLPELQELQVSIVWVFDGYDEMGRVRALEGELAECKVSVVSCRQQYVNGGLAGDVATSLVPSREGLVNHEVLYLRSFTRGQMLDFVRMASASKTSLQGLGTPTGFVRAIESVPSLKDLASNPFMLSIIVDQLPYLAEGFPQLRSAIASSASGDKLEEKHHSLGLDLCIHVTQTSLLGTFLRDYVSKSLNKWREEPDWPKCFENSFSAQCEMFCKNLAVMMFEKETHLVNPTQEPYRKLFSPDPASDEAVNTSFVLRSLPLQSQDGGEV